MIYGIIGNNAKYKLKSPSHRNGRNSCQSQTDGCFCIPARRGLLSEGQGIPKQVGHFVHNCGDRCKGLSGEEKGKGMPSGMANPLVPFS